MFSLKWDSYHKEIGSGFAYLQQSGEFVDMTLAAEGHLVKVHRNLIALASPYLKEMLSSAPCAHPIVYLNNISHKVLCYLLEYIYTGEVQIPNDMLSPFLQASKALCILGAKDIVSTQTSSISGEPQVDNGDRSDNFAAHITINNPNYNLEVEALENILNEDYQVGNNNPENENSNSDDMPLLIMQNGKKVGHDEFNENITVPNDIDSIDLSNIPNEIDFMEQSTMYSNATDIGEMDSSSYLHEGKLDLPVSLCNINNQDDGETTEKNFQPTSVSTQTANITNITEGSKIGIVIQYSTSNRGAVQLILNRFLYYCHHHSFGERKRRWRCIDYRKLHCQAYIDTVGEAIASRKGKHSHTYHDKKIMKKLKENKIYSSIPKTKMTSKKEVAIKEEPTCSNAKT